MPNTFQITDDIDAAETFVGVRMTSPMYLPDNVVAHCARCFCLIQHRPDVPPRLTKICIECAMPEMERAKATGELTVSVTKRHADEFIAFFNKKGGR